jgi:hypothetical protein
MHPGVSRVALFFCGLALLAASTLTPAADKEKKSNKVSGIVIADEKGKSITVKGDGDEEPVKYVVPDGTDKKVLETLKTTYTVSRVQLTYKLNGETRELVTIQRERLAPSGTVTGVVQAVHDSWWVEVKPKKGVADGYAPKFPSPKEMVDKVKALEKGDIVTIRFTSDNERHRIESIEKIGREKKKE